MDRIRLAYYDHRTQILVGIAVLAAASLVVVGVLVGRSWLGGEESDGAKTVDGGALPATAWKRADAGDVRDGGTLRLAVGTLPENFNPVQADGTSSDAAALLAPTSGGAVRITPAGGWEVDPDYARSVEVVDDDPLTVKVELNPKAVWQGGTSITAADMVAYWRAMSGQVDGLEVASNDGYDDIRSVEPGDDELTYTVTFDRPRSDWPRYVYPRLAQNVSTSKKLFNDGFRNRAVSSNGPFLVASIDPDTGSIVERRNPRWWGAPPRLDRIVWRIAKPAVQAAAFVAGELDAVAVDVTTYRTVAGHGVVQRASGSQWTHVTLNGGRGPLRDVDVRRAVAEALDRRAAAHALGEGVGAPGLPLLSHVLLPTQRGYGDAPVSGPDRSEARGLLEKAGYTMQDGHAVKDGKALTLSLPVPADTPTITARARRIVGDLARIGITVKTPTVPSDTFFSSTVVPLDFDLVTFTWTGSPFPVQAAEPRFRPIDSPQNYTGVTPKSLDPLWAKASEAIDPTDRARRIRTLDRRLTDAAVIIPLGVVPTVVVVRKGVVNYGATTFEQPDFTRVGFLKSSG